jgi:cytidylate kinase
VIVAIDGPAGAGKSTVARRLAERLGFRYVDTGAMYRALTSLAIERGASLDDAEKLAALARQHPVELAHGRVTIAENDVTQKIRSPEVDASVPVVARHERVRAVMRERQRELADEGDAVLEGRDIGRVVCPHAEVKVWLVADVAERARRRAAERPGTDSADLERRDALDAVQMRPADDAVELDTTDLGIDEVVDRIAGLVAARGRA